MVRYQNRLLHLERPSRPRVPAKSSRTGAGKRNGRSGPSLSRAPSGIPRTEGGFYSAERGKRRCPFPRAPIPKTKIVHPCG